MSERLLDHCSLQLLGDGRGFAMEVSGGASEPQRLELPVWMLHQLMRSLPHLDAALQQGQDTPVPPSWPTRCSIGP